MYDIVNDVFYTNAGTGEFLVGADVHYNIPPEYQQVEYLESTGTQYIELNIPHHDEWMIKFLTSTWNKNQHVFGNSKTILYQDYVNDFFHYTGYTWNTNYIKVGELDTNHIYQYSVKQISSSSAQKDFNGVLSEIPHKDLFQEGLYRLFHSIWPGTAGKWEGNIYEFYTKSQGNETLHLIPCFRKSDDEVGMYDLVSGKFYTNAGTGEFIVGPDII
jgi:hypothetical protein